MLVVNSSDFRNNMKKFLDIVCDIVCKEDKTVCITRNNGEQVVVISLEKYQELIKNMGEEK